MTEKLLREAETALDEVNFTCGAVTELCIQCKSATFKPVSGIVHKENCLIRRIREHLGDNND